LILTKVRLVVPHARILQPIRVYLPIRELFAQTPEAKARGYAQDVSRLT
jgi:excinuclease UvrABC ATPase subunit